MQHYCVKFSKVEWQVDWNGKQSANYEFLKSIQRAAGTLPVRTRLLLFTASTAAAS